MNPRGVIIRSSRYAVKESIDRIQGFLEGNGVTIYARIDQQSELARAGMKLPALQFLLFGKPMAGGPMMVENPISALDLPLKIIAWEDGQQNVWVACNAPAFIRERYDLPEAISGPLDLEPILRKVLD